MGLTEIAIGFAAGFAATVLFNIAPILQKAGVDAVNQQSGGTKAPSIMAYIKNKRWLAGFLVGAAAGLPFIISLTFLGISVVQPLTAFGYLLLVYVAVKKLGERLSAKPIAGVVMLALMPLFLTFANVSNVTANMLDPLVLSILFIFCISIGVASAAIVIVDRLVKNHSTYSSMLWAVVSGLTFGIGGTTLQGIFSFIQSGGLDLLRDLPRVPELLAAGNVFVISAIISVIACIILSLLGFVGQQMGYKKGNATSVYPVSQSINILVSITGGILIYGQQVGIVWSYAIAIAFTIIGTLLVGKYQTLVTTSPSKV